MITLAVVFVHEKLTSYDLFLKDHIIYKRGFSSPRITYTNRKHHTHPPHLTHIRSDELSRVHHLHEGIPFLGPRPRSLTAWVGVPLEGVHGIQGAVDGGGHWANPRLQATIVMTVCGWVSGKMVVVMVMVVMRVVMVVMVVIMAV